MTDTKGNSDEYLNKIKKNIEENQMASQSFIDENKSFIIFAMSKAIQATKNSIFPFGKKAKLKKLQDLRDKFQGLQGESFANDQKILISFFIEAQRTRNYFSRDTNASKSLKKSFKNNDELTRLFKIINPTKNNIEYILKEWFTIVREWYQTHKKIDVPPNVQPNVAEESTTKDAVTASLEEAQIKSNNIEDSPKNIPNLRKTEQTEQTDSLQQRLLKLNKKHKHPLEDVDPEEISAFADMHHKIKLIQKDLVRLKLMEIFGSNKTSKNNKSSESDTHCTEDELKKFIQLLIDAEILILDEKNGNKPIINSSSKNSEKAANLILNQNLTNLKYEENFIISKSTFTLIQTKAKELNLIKEAYTNSNPSEDGFELRCKDNLKKSEINFTKLTYSKYLEPLTEGQFKEIVSLGLTDAEKINIICGDILDIDTQTLGTRKINKSYFSSIGKSEEAFIKQLEIKLKEIKPTGTWSIDRLIQEKITLENNGLKLDIKMINSYLDKKNEPTSVETSTAVLRTSSPFSAKSLTQIKLKKTSPNSLNESSQKITNQPINEKKVATTMTEKQAMLAEVTGKKPATAQPLDLSGKNKITVNSNNDSFIKFIEKYLKSNFEVTTQKQQDKVEFNISSSKKSYASPDEIKQELIDLAKYIKSGIYKPFKEIFKLEKYHTIFINELSPQVKNKNAKSKNQKPQQSTLEIYFNENYEARKLEFETILNDSNVLFKKMENTYTINTSDWSEKNLINKFTEAKFTNDYFESNDEKIQKQINTELATQSKTVKFNLNIPNQNLKNVFMHKFNEYFGNDPEYYLDIDRFMIISQDKQQELQKCLKYLTNEHNFRGDYIFADNEDYAEIIESTSPYRLKITIEKHLDKIKEIKDTKDGEESQTKYKSKEFFNNSDKFDANERKKNDFIESPTEHIYYINLETLKNKKSEFFMLAAETRCEIEYYDKNKNKYQSIELANDSVYQNIEINSNLNNTSIFKQSLRNLKEEKSTNISENLHTENLDQLPHRNI